ncbi:DUF4292 domain-containing protein [Segatella asaccharophila]
MKRILFINTFALCLLVPLSSFGNTERVATRGGAKKAEPSMRISDHSDQDSGPTLAVNKLTFVQKVSDNRVYASNIVGHMSFHIQSEDKDITVPGYLRMRKNQVIRLQFCLPFIGTEVARIDFYPDSVLIIDRYHKQYVKAGYRQVPFLQKQGISFYSLQALFWNQLLLPGNQEVSESDLKKFDVNLNVTSENLPVTYQRGRMNYRWMADRMNGRINEVNIDYDGRQDGKTDLDVKYGNFQSVGVKWFPAIQNYTINTNATQKAHTVKMDIEMDEVTTTDKWETKTPVPDRYKQVPADDVLSKIMNM